MLFIDTIFSYVWDVSDYFWNAYQETKDWVWPFNLLQYPLYSLYGAFWHLGTPIAQLGAWCDDVASKIAKVLSQADILSLVGKWLTYAEDAWNWVKNAATNVSGIIGTWWGTTSLTVKAWIAAANEYTRSLIASVTASVVTLQASWDSFKGKIPSIDQVITWWGNFTGNILLVVNTWWSGALKDVQALIDSAFTTREGLWAGWQDWRDRVAEFFMNPVEFVWAKFTDWFLGPEG